MGCYVRGGFGVVGRESRRSRTGRARLTAVTKRCVRVKNLAEEPRTSRTRANDRATPRLDAVSICSGEFHRLSTNTKFISSHTKIKCPSQLRT